MHKEFLIGQISSWLLTEELWKFIDDKKYTLEQSENLAILLVGCEYKLDAKTIVIWLLNSSAWQFVDDEEYTLGRAEDFIQHLTGNWEMVKTLDGWTEEKVLAGWDKV